MSVVAAWAMFLVQFSSRSKQRKPVLRNVLVQSGQVEFNHSQSGNLKKCIDFEPHESTHWVKK